MAPVVPQRIVASLVGSGVLERFPDLHFVLVEFNAHWLVATTAAMDKAWTFGVGQFHDWWAGTWDDDRPDVDQPGMAQLFRLNERWPYPLMPSEYVRHQIHVSFQEDPVAIACRHATGISTLVWGADYPQPEGTFLHPRSDRVPVPRRRTRGPRRDPRRDARRIARRQGSEPGMTPYYDPYDVDIDADPYPVYRRLRTEAPLYYNERYDFFAVSRADDVERVLTDHDTFISGHGAFLDFIRADLTMPPGMLIFEDPPSHTRHRKVLSRVFTPRRMAELEPQVPRLLRPEPRPLHRRAPIRLRRRPGRPGADADDQHAARHPRVRSGRGPRRHDRVDAHEAGRGDADQGGRQPGDVRRVHRLARGAPIRRPHDRRYSKRSSRTRPARSAR